MRTLSSSTTRGGVPRLTYTSPCQSPLSVFSYFIAFLRVCTSNLSDFSQSPAINNFGPNLTLIFIPGTMDCPEPERAQEINTKQFSVEVTQDDTATSSQESNLFDCGESVVHNQNEVMNPEH